MNDFEKSLVSGGLLIMLFATLLFIFLPLTLKTGFGIGLLFVIGLGMCIAGSPDKE